MRRNPRIALNAVLFITTLLFHSVCAQRRDYKVKRWQRDKFWWWSSDAPMTKALDEIPDVVNGIKLILDHFKRVEDSIISQLGNKTPRRHDALLRPCTSGHAQDWAKSVDSNFGVRGFPQPDLSCITDFIGVQFSRDEIPPYTVDQLYEAILRRGAATQTNAKSIASRLMSDEGNFTRPAYPFNFRYATTSANCVLHPVQGGRVDDHWRTGTTIHNRPIDDSVFLYRRQLLVEFHRVVEGHLNDTAIMRLPVWSKNETERVIRDDATTLISSGRGNVNPSMFRYIPITENPALRDSLEMASILIQQAEDAVTPSNIAILVLPLTWNLVPVALFANVSTIHMLLYVILGDVLTITPLLIKGIELLQIQARRHRSVVTRLSSSLNSTRADAAAAEMWAAECQAKDDVRTVGVIFVSLSVVFLLFGTLMELAARSYVQRRKQRCSEWYTKSKGALSDITIHSSMSEEEIHKAGLLLKSQEDPVDFWDSSKPWPYTHLSVTLPDDYT